MFKGHDHCDLTKRVFGLVNVTSHEHLEEISPNLVKLGVKDDLVVKCCHFTPQCSKSNSLNSRNCSKLVANCIF